MNKRKCSFLILLFFTTSFLAACKRARIYGHLPHEDPISERKINDDVTIIGTPVKVTSIDDTIFVGQVIVHATLPNGTPCQILNRIGYTTSYNYNTKCPNWVAWHLTAEHTDGDIGRFNNYREDMDVPVPRATVDDYKGSNWSRGHMCPAGDNKWNSDAMSETFLLTNICPQHASLNSGLWNRIEQDCRKWAKEYGEVYIVCGPVFLNKEHETIGENKIVVPEAFFKVILCLKDKPKAIGFIVRNNEGTKKKDQFVNTVDDVERITGIDFFPSLPDEIENEVEAYSNLEDWK